MIFNDDFLEFLECLNKQEVKYVLVGGYAVVLHGVSRTTGDMDIFIEGSEENAVKVLKAIDDFGFGSLGFTKEDMMDPNIVVQMGVPPLRIDIISEISGTTFEIAFTNKIEYVEEDITIPIIHIKNLIENKIAAGRNKDQADAEALKKIQIKKGKK